MPIYVTRGNHREIAIRNRLHHSRWAREDINPRRELVWGMGVLGLVGALLFLAAVMLP